MPSKLETLLPKFKSTQLKQLAFLCGAKSSGRKAELVERLVAIANERFAEPPKTSGQQLILSIDLGIRNLGYSLLAPAASPRSSGRRSSKALTADDLRRPPRIHLHAWQRRELLEPSPDGLVDPERYSPASLAIAADRLVRRDLLPLKPTHVLIERQRWRSGGASAVQEWTLRVNTLEAMLHASLRTLRELGHWDGEIVSVGPEKVTKFWPTPPATASGEDTPKTKGSRSSKGVVGKAPKKAKSQQSSKKHKIGVLTGWLAEKRGSEIIIPANHDTEEAIKQYREKLVRARRSSAANKELVQDIGSKKLDDLTDSLLQGVAWLKWEENKALLLGEDGITKLLDSDLLDVQEADVLLDDV
ncbi:Ydc2-catalyt-domain-containing protein [Hypoxylon sp. FL1857]|nr:Ydc2-catalyt-domain-containing protein [Hypoxylon sp. FL1857]